MNKNILMFWMGQSISLVGSWMQQTAFNWIIVTKSHSITGISKIYLFSYGSLILFAIPGGFISDWFFRKNILIFNRSFHALLSLTCAFLILNNALEISAICFIIFLLGVLTALEIPTQQAFIADLAENELTRAASLNLSIFHTSRLIGPLFASLCIINLSVNFIFLLNALSFVVGILTLLMIKNSPALAQPRAIKSNSIKDCLIYLSNHPKPRIMIGINFISAFFILPYLLIFTAFCVKNLAGGDIKILATTMSISGAGAILGTLSINLTPGLSLI